MKKIPIILFTGFLTLFFSCSTLQNISKGLSEWEMAAGLREALTQGLFSGFEAFANPNQGNALVRFAFPDDAAKIENTLKDLGLTSVVNRMTSKFTNAMSLAVQQAKPMFINSVKQMTIADAANILLSGNRHAATEYFKSKMSAQLMTAFRPIIDSTIRTTGANAEYQTIAKAYNAIPFLDKKLSTNLNDFIAARAVDAMFLYVANEEENIRTRLEYRKTDLLKRVFGYADQQNKSSGTGIFNY